MSCRGSNTRTRFADGTGCIVIDIEPRYQGVHAGPEGKRHVFSYRVLIENAGTCACRLLWRRWHIRDGNGRMREVQGSGVVGRQPTIAPGEAFRYESFCPLVCPAGEMSGAFVFEDERGHLFEARIAPFVLDADAGDTDDEIS